jgi:hypothetical protein
LNPDTDPDPTFQVNPDNDTDLDPIRIEGFETEEKIQQKFVSKSCFEQKLQLTYVLATREAFSPPALQKMKFMDFFLCLSVSFTLLDPDTDPGTH